MNRILRNLLSGITIAILALVTASAANAASIRLTSGAEQVIINDDQPGDLAPGLGIVAFFGSVGVFDFTGTLGVVVGTAPPAMVLNLNTTSTDTGELVVEFSEQGFNSTGTLALIEAEGNAGNALAYETFQDTSNILFGQTLNLTTNAALPPGGPYVFVNSGTAVAAAPYSLTQQVTVFHTAAGQSTSFGGSLAIVPGAPVPDGGLALGLLGFALIGVEGFRRKYTRI